VALRFPPHSKRRARLIPRLIMAAVSETIVAIFEMHGFFVRQQRKYVAPTRREDEEIDFFVLNLHHATTGSPLPFC